MESENTNSPNAAQRAWLWFKGLGRLGKALVIVGLLFVLAVIAPISDEPEPQPVAQVTVEQEDDSQAKVEEAERKAAEAEERAAEAERKAEEAEAAAEETETTAEDEAEEARRAERAEERAEESKRIAAEKKAAQEAEESAAAEEAEKAAAEEKAAKAAEEKAAAEAAAEEDTTDRDIQLMAMEFAWNDASYEDQELMCMGILLDEEAMIDSFLEGADGSAYALTRDDISNFFHSKCYN